MRVCVCVCVRVHSGWRPLIENEEIMTVFKRVMEETPGDGGIYGVMWSQWKSIGPLGINLLSFAQHKNAVCKHILYLFPYLTDFFFFLSPLADGNFLAAW